MLALGLIGTLVACGFGGRLLQAQASPIGPKTAVTGVASVATGFVLLPSTAGGPAATSAGEVLTTPVTILDATEDSSSGPIVVSVRLAAVQPVGAVSLAVVLGDLVLGSTVASMNGPDPIASRIPIVVPQFAVQAEVRVMATAGPGDTILARGHVLLSPAGRIQVWSAQIRQSSPRAMAEVEVVGPATVSELHVGVRSPAGLLMGSAVATRTGSNSETGVPKLLGLARYYATVPIDSYAGGSFRVDVSWQDPVDGTEGLLLQAEEGWPVQGAVHPGPRTR